MFRSSFRYLPGARMFLVKVTYLLTPCSRVLLEKLTGSAASQEITRTFGTRRYITAFTSARHLSLSWANSIQSPQPPPTSWWSILILSSHLRLGLSNGLFPTGFPTRTLYTSLPCPIRAPLLKSLTLKFVKNGKISMWWCGSITFGVCTCVVYGEVCCSPAYLSLQNARTHTKYYAAASPYWLLTFLTNFKISDFNKEHTSSLKMIWMMIETCWSVFKCFNMNVLD